MQRSVSKYLSYSMIYFFYFFALAAFGSMLSVYLAGENKSSSEISMTVSAAGIFTMVLQPFVGMLYDRTGWRKKLSVILLLLSAVTGIFFAFTHNTVLLLLLNGFSMAFFNSVNPVAEQVASASPYRYGVIRLWGAIGYAVGTQVAGMILDYADPMFMFIVFAVAAVLTAISFHKAGLKDTEPVTSSKKESSENREKGKLGLPLVLFAIFSFFFSGVTTAGSTYVPMLLRELLGGTSLAGTVLFLGTMMEIPIIFLSNRFMDRLSGRQLLIINTALLLIQGAAYSFSSNAVLVCAVLIVTKSVTTMLFIMVTLKVVMNITGGRYATTALSIIATVKSLGGVVLTNMSGRISDAAGLHAIFPVLLAITAAMLILSFFIRIPVDDKKYFAGEE